jgi:D-amino-acid dehydrogenase
MGRSTPTNIPCIGRSRIDNLWVNAGHGTLGWTHGAGSGKAMAELIGGRQPRMNFRFHGFDEMPGSPAANPAYS